MALKNFIKPTIISCLLPLALTASAEGNMFNSPSDYNFATVRAGVNQPTDVGGSSQMDSGRTTYAAGLEVGRKMMDQFAVSVEYNHRGKSEFNSYSGDAAQNTSWAAQSETFMLNVSADLLKDSKVTPYVKVGAGTSSNKSYEYKENINIKGNTNTYAGKTENSFAWQVGTGLNIATSEMFDTDVSYMFINRGKIKTAENYTVNGGSVTSPAITGHLRDYVVAIGFKVKF